MTRGGSVRARVGKVRSDGDGPEVVWDRLAVEDPLEIRLGHGPDGRRAVRPVAVTMRTPGHDDELAVGFLLSERIVAGADAIERVAPEPAGGPGRRLGDAVRVDLRPGVVVDPGRLGRNFAATSSCGVCGKASLRALGLDGCAGLSGRGPRVEAAAIRRLPEALRRSQDGFEATGALHAAALFDAGGAVIAVREDIGRHNAVDKLVGARGLGRLDGAGPPVGESIGLLVSGRLGFEIVQKALVAGVALVAAIGAPSSLAVEVAEAFGMTLLGFVGPRRFNIYSGAGRIRQAEAVGASAAGDRRD